VAGNDDRDALSVVARASIRVTRGSRRTRCASLGVLAREPWLSGAAGEMLGRAPIGARQWAISKIPEPPGALRIFACTCFSPCVRKKVQNLRTSTT
jgi:hypothetical protein